MDLTDRGKLRVSPVSTFKLKIEEHRCSHHDVTTKISEEAFGGNEVILLSKQNVAYKETSIANSK